jgi:hypothetical protein
VLPWSHLQTALSPTTLMKHLETAMAEGQEPTVSPSVAIG